MTNELFYEISGEDQNCLQVILKQNEALIADSTSVCWFSENLDIENMDSMWSVFFGWRTDLLRLKNKALSPVVVGLAVPQNGRILALGFAGTSTRGLFCFKESFVAANSETTVEIRPFPQQSKYLDIICCCVIFFLQAFLGWATIIYLQSHQDCHLCAIAHSHRDHRYSFNLEDR